MIFLKKGQVLATNGGLVVHDQTGYYEDGDTVVCASVIAPDEPLCRYEAKFIAYGDQVYSITKEDELMQEILKKDSKTLFGKNRAQAEAEKLLTEIMERDAPPPPPAPVEPPPVVEAPVQTPVATSTPPVATSTPPVATSTPPVIKKVDEIIDVLEPTPLEVPTSTPPVMPTSTPPVIPLEAIPPPPVLEVIPEVEASSEVIKGSIDGISSRGTGRRTAGKIARVVRKKR